jgi:hypothetical protein
MVRDEIMHSTHRLSFRRIAIACVLAVSSIAAYAASKGPDGGGYTASDETIYSFIDISGAGGAAVTLAGTDDGTSAVTLPFAFRFYGTSYSVGCVSANGALYFVPASPDCTGFDADFANTDLTAAQVPNDRPAMLPFWTDLTFQENGAGGVLYQALGTAPARRFVLQWNNAYPQGSSSPVTFQIVLSESNNSALFQYKNVALESTDPAHNGGHATIGIRNAGAPANTQLLQWSVNVPVVANNSAILFTSASIDSSRPILTATAPGMLWPPNGKTVPVQVRGTITDAGSGVNRSSVRFAVTDEYGAVHPSGAITLATDGSFSVNVPLVANRLDADKDGRKYTIVVTARDNAGNEGAATVVVVVPHDQGK